MRNFYLVVVCLCALVLGCKKEEAEDTIVGKWQVVSYGPVAIQSKGVWLDADDKPYEKTTIPPTEVTGKPWIWEINGDMTFKNQTFAPAGFHMPSSGTYTYANNVYTHKGGSKFEVAFGKNKTMKLSQFSYLSSGNGFITFKLPFNLKRIN